MLKNEKIVFASFFPSCENIHLVKEVGSVPYFLQKDYGYEAFLISYKNGEYPYLGTEVPGLRMHFMRKGMSHALESVAAAVFGRGGLISRKARAFCTALDALPLLLNHGREIDVLELVHLDDTTVAVAWLYKAINRKGITYFKLDMDPMVIKEFEEDPALYQKRNYAFYRDVPADLLSVETRELYEFARAKHPYFSRFGDRLFYLPNGIDTGRMSQFSRDFSAKESIVLHVGRIGAYQKASEVVLECFGRAARDLPGWELVIIGGMEKGFERRFEKFREDNPDIRERIKYLGFLDPREKVYEYYGRSKVLMFPSRFESFGFVAAEAESLGCVVLGSDIPAIRELTGGHGCLCPVDNADCFTERLRYLLSHEGRLKEMASGCSRYIIDNYGWHAVCGVLDRAIRERLVKGRGA
jgi:glycosyltransferase involved in cell wall biosynthesis